MDAQELLKHATEFTFYPEGAKNDEINGDHHKITVTERSPGRWAVIHMGQCWDGEDWDYEASPSNRTDAFKKKTRFSLEKAIELASGMVETVLVNGRTYSQWQEHFKGVIAWEESRKKENSSRA